MGDNSNDQSFTEYQDVPRTSSRSQSMSDCRIDSVPVGILQSASRLANEDRIRDHENIHVETVFPDGLYVGGLNIEGVPHGTGKMKFYDGTVYDGEWQHGKMNGHGVSTFNSVLFTSSVKNYIVS
jgi:hypothetical protein